MKKLFLLIFVLLIFMSEAFPQRIGIGIGVWNRRHSAPVSDSTKPIVSSFSIPSNSGSLEIGIISFIATDNFSVTGYKITENSNIPLPLDAGWQITPHTSYTFSSQGFKTLYAWAKDAAGNVSNGVTAQVTINIVSDAFIDPETGEMIIDPDTGEYFKNI